MSKATADELRAAKARIGTPAKWTKGWWARDAEGAPIESFSDAPAVSFCALGAVDWDLGGGGGGGGGCRLSLYAALPAGFEGISDFNDAPSTTHADVMALFDRAIAIAEGVSAAPWTEAHEREALRRTYEIAAWLAGAGLWREANWLCEGAVGFAENEAYWRDELSSSEGPSFDTARVDREVRRVRGLAEGRLVRELVDVRYELRNLGGEVVDAAPTRDTLTPTNIPMDHVVRVCVTRIRRAR